MQHQLKGHTTDGKCTWDRPLPRLILGKDGDWNNGIPLGPWGKTLPSTDLLYGGDIASLRSEVISERREVDYIFEGIIDYLQIKNF